LAEGHLRVARTQIQELSICAWGMKRVFSIFF
jgi:hypothetical protein